MWRHVTVSSESHQGRNRKNVGMKGLKGEIYTVYLCILYIGLMLRNNYGQQPAKGFHLPTDC